MINELVFVKKVRYSINLRVGSIFLTQLFQKYLALYTSPICRLFEFSADIEARTIFNANTSLGIAKKTLHL